MKWSTVVMAVILALGLTVAAMAANTDNHTVTVQVNAINEIATAGGNLALTINTATAGSNPDNAVDNTTCDLDWTTNEASKKITVVSSLSLAAQSFTLKAVAQNVTGGTAASEVTLSDTAADFVTGIATTIGGGDLQYTASALASEGTGSDAHTVTYTVTAS